MITRWQTGEEELQTLSKQGQKEILSQEGGRLIKKSTIQCFSNLDVINGRWLAGEEEQFSK